MASPVSAVWPPTSYPTPRSPAARPSVGSRVVSTRTCPIAVAFSGSVSYTSAKRTADRRSERSSGLTRGSRKNRRPDDAGHAGLPAQRAFEAVSRGGLRSGAGSDDEHLGRREYPWREPGRGGAAARATSDDAGISPISGDPSPSSRAAEAAPPSPATHAATTSNATGLEVANRRAANGRRGPRASEAGRVGSRRAWPGGRGKSRNINPPNTPSSAGINVKDTTMDTSTVAASAGPKAPSRPPRATTSAPLPAATISPAVKTIGADAEVESRAACRRPAPSASRDRIPARKNTQ